MDKVDAEMITMLPVEASRALAGKLGGYVFRNDKLILEALTHSTYAYEHRMADLPCNERLEFLGDAILDQVVSEQLFNQPEMLSEGTMTRMRSLVVCENTLAGLARQLGIGGLLLMGRGEEQTGGRDKSSNLANAMEAIFGAIFLDAGYETVRRIILDMIGEPLRQALAGTVVYDYKSRLLELAQSHKSISVHFAVLEEKGPVHNRVYTSGAFLQGRLVAQGSGGSKKEAEQQASQIALTILENDKSFLEE